MSTNVDKAKGKVEQAVGDLTGDDELKRQGKVDEAAGNVKDVIEGVTDKAEELVDKAKDALHRD